MTNILAERIQHVKLTKAQKKIAEYFIANQERIGTLSSVEAAREIGVSDASIIRFSRAIGYAGFADLKADIYKTLTEDANERFSSLSLNERMAISAQKYPDAEVSLQYLNLMQESLANTFRINNNPTFQNAADAIINASSRFVIGERGCYGVASHFARVLSLMIPNVRYCFSGGIESVNTLLDVSEKDVVVFFSYRRYYQTDLCCIETAKKHGAKICLITDDRFGPLSAYADILLIADTRHMSFFNSTTSTTVISEYILTLIGRKINFVTRTRERDELTENFRL